MSHFKVLKIIVFNGVLSLKMEQYFEPSNIISTTELNFERKNLKRRWCRVKEYFLELNPDEHWKKSFKAIKQIFRDTKIYPRL